MTRPLIDEYDCGSYFEGSISAFAVLTPTTRVGLQCDGSPDLEIDFGNDDLCESHAFERARSLGFVGPLPVRIAFGSCSQLETEWLLVKSQNGEITHVADYGYGRAYFEPGEERSKLCAICGVETLVDGFI